LQITSNVSERRKIRIFLHFSDFENSFKGQPPYQGDPNAYQQMPPMYQQPYGDPNAYQAPGMYPQAAYPPKQVMYPPQQGMYAPPPGVYPPQQPMYPPQPEMYPTQPGMYPPQPMYPGTAPAGYPAYPQPTMQPNQQYNQQQPYDQVSHVIRANLLSSR
jgi:hypothetical protein